MPRVGFEPTITPFEWAKTFHAVYCTATVIDIMISSFSLYGSTALWTLNLIKSR
jgi:hypothetical protein